MPNGIDDLKRLDEEAAGLVARSQELMQGGRFEEALPLTDRVDEIISRLRTTIGRFRTSGLMPPREATQHLRDLEIKRAHNDTRKAVSLRSLGRLDEAKRIYHSLLNRSNLPDLNAFSTMLNLASLHGVEGEKKQAWDAFHQAEMFHERLGTIQGGSELIRQIRTQLIKNCGHPPPRPDGRGRRRRR